MFQRLEGGQRVREEEGLHRVHEEEGKPKQVGRFYPHNWNSDTSSSYGGQESRGERSPAEAHQDHT